MANHEPLNNCDKALYRAQVYALQLYVKIPQCNKFQFFTTDVPNLGSSSALPMPNIAAARNAWKRIGMESMLLEMLPACV